MKRWEDAWRGESWEASRYKVHVKRADGHQGIEVGSFLSDAEDGTEDAYSDRGRATLAAQAPAMARLLLSLGAMDVYDTDARGRPVHMDRYRCSWCDGESEDVATVPHLHDCRLVAVLKAAGVIE